MKIKTLDGKATNRVFGLLSGKQGMGKTTQGTTFPQKETLLVSVEDGFLSIEGSGYAMVEISSYDELIDILEKEIKKNKWVKYLYIDSLTEIYDLLSRELSQKYSRKDNFAKHADMKDMLLYAVRTARQLTDINIWFTCHTKESKDGLYTTQELAFDGKLPSLIKKQFDLCVLMDFYDVDDSGKEERVFITSPEISPAAKRRASPWLNVEIKDIEEPNLYKLGQKLLGK